MVIPILSNVGVGIPNHQPPKKMLIIVPIKSCPFVLLPNHIMIMNHHCYDPYNVGPPTYKSVYNPINYRYIYHKS